ncbi:MAG: hypothetical protein KDA87_17690, partial [Planctomycetales bacterium]|nr:hypothetical protein [Planctomycetales bacterium]
MPLLWKVGSPGCSQPLGFSEALTKCALPFRLASYCIPQSVRCGPTSDRSKSAGSPGCSQPLGFSE